MDIFSQIMNSIGSCPSCENKNIIYYKSSKKELMFRVQLSKLFRMD